VRAGVVWLRRAGDFCCQRIVDGWQLNSRNDAPQRDNSRQTLYVSLSLTCCHSQDGTWTFIRAVVYCQAAVVTARSELRKVLFFGAVSLWFLFVYEIPPERLNGFARNSRGRRVWSLAWTSSKVKVKCQRSRSPGTKNGILALSAACMRFVW